MSATVFGLAGVVLSATTHLAAPWPGAASDVWGLRDLTPRWRSVAVSLAAVTPPLVLYALGELSSWLFVASAAWLLCLAVVLALAADPHRLVSRVEDTAPARSDSGPKHTLRKALGDDRAKVYSTIAKGMFAATPLLLAGAPLARFFSASSTIVWTFVYVSIGSALLPFLAVAALSDLANLVKDVARQMGVGLFLRWVDHQVSGA